MADTITLPSNVEAERCVLGSMLLSSSAASSALAALSDEAFSGDDPRNRIIFHAMRELADKAIAIDPQTLNDQLALTKLKEEADSPSYLFDLINTSINPNNVDHYINIVRDQYVLRSFLLRMEKAKKEYADGKVENVGDYLTNSVADLEAISSSRSVGGFQSAREASEMTKNKINLERNRSNKKLSGIDTGFPVLNDYTHGWQPSSLVVIGARPSVGKTAFSINLAYYASSHSNRSVAFFSCEMPNDQIIARLTSALSLVPLENIQLGMLSNTDLVKVTSALDQISNTKLFFDDTPNQKLGDIMTKSRKLAQQHPDLCAIFIDYLNIISVETKYDSRNMEISLITKSLKELARSLKLPIILLAQVSRDAEKNDSKVPMMSQLKESGSIEQDADMILLMYRGDYYTNLDPTTKVAGPGNSEYRRNLEEGVKEAKQEGNDKGSVSIVDINLAKNRNGKTGKISLLFSKNYQRFDTPSNEEINKRGGDSSSMNINPIE